MKKFVYKILIGLVLVLSLSACLNVVNSFAFAKSIFYVNDGVICGLTEYPTEDLNLVIPAEIDGAKITKISSVSGNGIHFTQEEVKNYIKSVDLTNATNLLDIGIAFNGCTNLSGTIILPENIKTIQRLAFFGTSIDKVVVKHLDTSLTIAGNSFPSGTRFVFQSEDVKNEFYSNNQDVWANYEMSYLYDLKIDLGDTIITTIKVEIGGSLGDDYSKLITENLSGYRNVELYQGATKVDENTILDGTTLTMVSSPRYDHVVEYNYGDEISLTPEMNGQSYSWSYDGEVVSSNKTLVLNNLNVGEYVYSCLVENNGTQNIVYKVIVNPTKYDFSWPIIARYNYFEISDEVFLSETEQNDLTISYYKFDGTNYNQVNSFSIGLFKAVITTNNSNYYIENTEFQFEIGYVYLDIVWESSVYNYTGESISPAFYLYGDKKGQEVEILVGNSDVSAVEVGTYTIVVSGLSNEYFALREGTVTTYNWEIIPTTLDIDWNETEFSYNASTQNLEINGVYNDITIPLEVKGSDGNNITISSVGRYDIMVQIPSKYTGFSLNGSNQKTIEVVPSKLDVAFTSDSTYIYNGQYVEIVAIITTQVSEDISLILENHYEKDAGEYTAKVVGVNNSNYYVDEGIEFDWEIIPKPLIVRWNVLAFEYTGNVIKPYATVETGIDGETLQLITVADDNINANEDDALGYKATAKLHEDVKNYTISNDDVRYRIVRATPNLELIPEQEVVYNGKNQLPSYKFNGDASALKILVNGVETSTGIKEVGVYNIQIKCEQSTNYKALTEDYFCNFIIKALAIGKTIENMTISLVNSNGFYETEPLVGEVKEHYIEVKNQIAKLDNLELYKAFYLQENPMDNGNETTMEISIKGVEANRIKVYLLSSGRNLNAVNVDINDDKISFAGVSGTYYIFVENRPFFSTTAGILTVTFVIVLVVVAFVYFTIFKSHENKEVARLVEERLQEKIKNGEQITTITTMKIRQQVVEELKNKSKKNNKK